MLKDIFENGFDYKSEINRIIDRQIAADPQNYFSGENMGFTSIDETQRFYIQDDQLVIYFNQYEIAPYAAGIPEFTIPLASLRDHLNIQ